MLLHIVFCGCTVLAQVTAEETRPGHYLIEVLSGDDDDAITEPGSDYGDDDEYGSDYGGGWTPAPYGKIVQEIETQPPVTCNWDNWGGWNRGSHACGSGTKSRSRSCRCSDGSNGGGRCGGGSSQETAQDNKPACVTCRWDRWGPWSGGNHTCGQGSKSRSRTCQCSDGSTGQASKCGGGRSSETAQDNKGPCVTCTWDRWGAWSGGGQSCGVGTKSRSRTCRCSDGTTGQPSKCGGGSTSQTEQVNNGPCTTQPPATMAPVWTPKPYRRRMKRMRRM